MDRGVALVLTAVVGGFLALQAPMNSTVGRGVGAFQAALLSFLVGTVLLCLIASLAGGGLGRLAGLRDVPWYYLAGGVLGAAYVTNSLVAVRALGAGGIVAATIAGQLAASVVVDHFGVLGVERQPVTLARVAGVLLLAAGVFLIVRD